MKELLVQLDVMEKANEETKIRLSEEIEKHDKLLAGLLEANERLSIKQAKLREDEEAINLQEK